MATLSEGRIAALLEPYLQVPENIRPTPAGLYGQLSRYLDLLVRWNARTNLTAVRSPEEMVRRHFGESLFAGICLAPYVGAGTEVLDLGSGAGFPGVPVQLWLPEVRLTLAESQGKKVAFLREVVRVLGSGAEVWAGRVEEMDRERRFGAVMLRAVDRMGAMVEVGRLRVERGGVLVQMTTEAGSGGEVFAVPERVGSYVRVERVVE